MKQCKNSELAVRDDNIIKKKSHFKTLLISTVKIQIMKRESYIKVCKILLYSMILISARCSNEGYASYPAPLEEEIPLASAPPLETNADWNVVVETLHKKYDIKKARTVCEEDEDIPVVPGVTF